MSKVRFDVEPATSPSEPVVAATNTSATSPIQVNFGLLLLSGIYTTGVNFETPAPGGQHTSTPQVLGLTASNLSAAVEPGPTTGQHQLVLRLWADSEGPFEETFYLSLPPDQEVEVRVTATVFSRRKGTPGLKPHVHLVGFSADADTEAASDWQGFG